MADEQAPETQADPTATDSTSTPIPAPDAQASTETPAEAAPETPDAAASPEAASEPEAESKGRPGWDKAQQKRDEEMARLRKQQDEQSETIKALLEQLVKKDATPTAKPQAVDPIEAQEQEVERLLAEARKVNKGDDETPADPFRANELLAEAAEKQNAIRRAERLKAQERERAAREDASWETQFVQAHPTVPLDKGKEAVKNAWAYARSKGLDGEAGKGAAQAHYDLALEALKKSNPSPKSAPVAPKTAPAAGGNAPAGVRVIPVPGARQEPVQYSDAAKSITQKLLASRGK